MARKRLHKNSAHLEQLPLDFERVIETAQVFSRDEVAAEARSGEAPYDPVEQTTNYMRQLVEAESRWETTLEEARATLLRVDPRELYFEFIADLKHQINTGSARSGSLARLLEHVAYRGLGIERSHLTITAPSTGGSRYRVLMDDDAIRDHLGIQIVGNHFLNVLTPSDERWCHRTPLIGASDVSQHRSAIPVPARYFKRSVPFVLNNAAGTLYHILNGQGKYENVFNPKPDDALLRWMLIDPSYQDELEPEDYNRCIGSAMDVGQYKFDLDYLMKGSSGTPDVVLRDGSLFPQDAYLDNFAIQSKRGDFTREAIRDLLACLLYTQAMKAIYCGVTKSVQLKVYSAVVDWFVALHVDPAWSFGNYTLNDGQAMSLLLASPSFVGTSLEKVTATCLIRRSFTTRAALNTRVGLSDIETYFTRIQDQNPDIDIKPHRSLCGLAHLYTFFAGHSKSPQQQLPRYEYFHFDEIGEPWQIARAILSAVRCCGLMNDMDHSFMADEPITYLIPAVTQQAHSLSKDVGRAIDSATGQWIMARYHRYLAN
jgi:hypothetical protein